MALPLSSKNGTKQKAIPSHQRSRRSFAGTFERDHAETIAAMDSGGHDIPRQKPRIRLALRNVGIRRDSIPVNLIDPLGGSEVVQLPCKVDARVALGGERRGIHVSRIGDLLSQLSARSFVSLSEYSAELLRCLRTTQAAESATVAVEGVLTYFERVKGVKEKGSLEHLTLSGGASSSGEQTTSSSGIGFNHITACPCVQETYRHSFSSQERSLGKGKLQLITHTQRCQTRIALVNLERVPSLTELLAAIDAVVVRSQNTLPREFELLNVHRAHAEPQFLEDVLRDLLRAVYSVVRPISARGGIEISSISLESIHDFDLHGEIAFSIKELDRAFASSASNQAMNGKHSSEAPAARKANTISVRSASGTRRKKPRSR